MTSSESYILAGVGKSAAERFERLLKPWLEGNVGKMSADWPESVARLEGFEPTTLSSEDRCSVR